MIIRPYQKEALEKIKAKYEVGVNKQLLVLPTGTGKTFIFAGIKECLNLPGKILLLAHREELLEQSVNNFLHWNKDYTVSTEKAEKEADPNSDIVLASVQTIGKKNSSRIKKFNPEEFSLVIIEECHHSVANSYYRVLDYFGVSKSSYRYVRNNPCLLVGFTATPIRSDKVGLESVFDEIVYSYPIYESNKPSAIGDGWLVDIKALQIKTNISLDSIRTRLGDLVPEELEKAINVQERNNLIVQAWLKHGENRQTIGFCAGVKHAQELASLFNTYNISCQAVWGNDEHRKEKLIDFREEKTKVLLNHLLISEGIDIPNVSCLILARPTKSQLVFVQQIGRGLRLHKSTRNLLQDRRDKLPIPKEDCLILDITDNTSRHSLITVSSLFGLPRKLDLNGKSLIESIQEFEEKAKQFEDVDFKNLNKLDEINHYIEEVSLFDGIRTEDIQELTNLQWIKVKENHYRLPLPIRNVNSYVDIYKDTNNYWNVKTFHPSAKIQIDDKISQLSSAFIYADSWVASTLKWFEYNFIKVNSKVYKNLKKKPASKDQLTYIMSLTKLPLSDRMQKLSMTDASAIISRLVSLRK